MSDLIIEPTTMGQLRENEKITGVDDDDLTTVESINEAYDPSDQDWHTVTALGVRTVTLTRPTGEVITMPYDGAQTVWRLAQRS